MIATHRTTVHSRCPENDGWDYYEVLVETDRTIKVEDIEAAINEVRGRRMYQEDLTKHLATVIGAKITITGAHGNFHTKVTHDLSKRPL